NGAAFDHFGIASAIIERFAANPDRWTHESTDRSVKVSCREDIFTLLSDDLLEHLFDLCTSGQRNMHRDVITAYVMEEFIRRGMTVGRRSFQELVYMFGKN